MSNLAAGLDLLTTSLLEFWLLYVTKLTYPQNLWINL